MFLESHDREIGNKTIYLKQLYSNATLTQNVFLGVELQEYLF